MGINGVGRPPRESLLIGLLFIFLGTFAFVLGNFSLGNINRKDLVPTKGVVIDYDDKYSDGETLYAIIVEYEVDGQFFTIKGNSYSNTPRRIGSVVKLKYNPKNPAEAYLYDSKLELYIVGIISAIFVGLGLLSIGIGINDYRKIKKGLVTMSEKKH